MSEGVTTTKDLPEATPDREIQPAKTSRRFMRILGILMLALAGVLTWYFAIFYVGWQSGQTILEDKREAELTDQLNRQISLAEENIEQDNYALALRRLEWVLDQAPGHPEALALSQQAEAGLETFLTPLPAGQPTVSPSSTPLPTSTPRITNSPDAEFQHLGELLENENWEDAIPTIIQFQWQFPSYNRPETDQMLYEAYIGRGLELVEGEQVELGLSYFEKAEKLGDLPESVSDYRTWAELYLQGIAFYNVNWRATVYYFRDLCLAAPFYQSSCERLQEALIAYGDQYANSLDWCPAQALYEEAIQQGRSQQLASKLDRAREACLTATPTPSISELEASPITATLPLTDTFFVVPVPTPKSDRP